MELFPELGIVGDLQDAFANDLSRQCGVSRKIRIHICLRVYAPGSGSFFQNP